MLKLGVSTDNGRVIVSAPPTITLGETSNAVRTVIKALGAAGFSNVALDLSNTPYIDSSGLGTLVATHHYAKSAGGVLTLSGLGKQFTEVLTVTKLITVFNVEQKPLRASPQIEIEGDDVSMIKAAQGLPLILSLRENRIRIELGMQDGVFKVRPNKSSRGSSFILASQHVIAEATRTLFSEDVKEFEELVNSAGTSEDDIHEFLEEHPNFLLGREYRELHSKVLLERADDGPLIPDFMLQPFETGLCDLLDLKLPRERVIVGTHNRRRFSGAVQEAVAQLRTYRDYFEDKTRREEILRRYNIRAYRPRLTVVIGRDTLVDPIEYRQIVDGQKEVKVMTYDQLLARAKRFLIV